MDVQGDATMLICKFRLVEVSVWASRIYITQWFLCMYYILGIRFKVKNSEIEQTVPHNIIYCEYWLLEIIQFVDGFDFFNVIIQRILLSYNPFNPTDEFCSVLSFNFMYI